MSIAAEMNPYEMATIHPDLAPAVRKAGLSRIATQDRKQQFSRALTGEPRFLRRKNAGLTVREFGEIDLTGGCHPEEPIDVLRPSRTLAIDSKGRRWVAETFCNRGRPGPIWCVSPDPGVALLVARDLGAFLAEVSQANEAGELTQWCANIDQRIHGIWSYRGELAHRSYEACYDDPQVQDWVALLPSEARLYDLRQGSRIGGWPYGEAGPDGRIYRCGELPVFAVTKGGAVDRWHRHMSGVAKRHEFARPAVSRQAA